MSARILLGILTMLSIAVIAHAQTPDQLLIRPHMQWQTYSYERDAVELSHYKAHGRKRLRWKPEPEKIVTGDGLVNIGKSASSAGTDAASLTDMAFAEFKRGSFSRSQKLFRKALSMQRRLHKKEDHRDLATAIINLGLICNNRHNYAEARRLFKEALAMQRRLSNGADNFQVASTLNIIGVLDFNRAEYPDARMYLEEGLAMHRRLCGINAHPEYAQSLYNLGLFYHHEGRYAAADSILDESISMLRVLDTAAADPRFANTLDAIATLRYERGMYADSRRLFAEALAVRYAWPDNKDAPEVARSLSNLGVIHERMGNYRGADSCLTAALAIARHFSGGRNDSTLALRISNLGNLYARYGEPGLAEPLLVEAAEMYRRLYDGAANVDLVRSINALGRFYMLQGRYDKSQPYFEEALVMFRRLYKKIHRLELAGAYSGVGRTSHELGDYTRAAHVFSEAMQMYRRKPEDRDDRAFAEALVDLGNFYSDRDEFARAGPLLEEAREMLSILGVSADDPGLARCLHHLGLYYHHRGDVAGAEKLLNQAMEMRYAIYPGKEHRYIAESLYGLSVIRAEQGNPAEALKLLERALAMLRRLGDNAGQLDLAKTTSALGALYLEQGNYRKAQSYLEESLDIHRRWNQGKDHPNFANAIRNLGIYYAYAGDIPRADTLFAKATGMYHNLYDNVGQLDMMLGIATIARFAEKFGMSNRADSSYGELLQMLSRVTKESSLFESEEQQIRFQARVAHARYSLLGFLLDRQETGDLYNAALLSKGTVLSAVEWRNQVLAELGRNRPDVAAELQEFRHLRREFSDTHAPIDGSDQERRRIQRDTVRARVERMEGYLARQSAASRKRRQEIITWRGVQRQLKRKDCVVEFIRVPRSGRRNRPDSVMYCALVLRSDKLPPTLVPLCQERELEPILRHGVDMRTRETSSYVHDAGNRRKLYNLIWQPVDTLLAGMQNVYICPDGLLNRISLGVLKNESGEMLLQRYDIRYLFSSRDLILPHGKDVIVRPVSKKAVVMGGVRFDADSSALSNEIAQLGPIGSVGDSGDAGSGPMEPARKSSVGSPLQPLQGSLTEANSIAAIMRRYGYAVTTYTDVRANEETFARLVSPAVLHIATHGFFFPDLQATSSELDSMQLQWGVRMVQYADNSLFRSGILLAGANRVWTLRPPAQGIEDGIVTAYEIAHMNLTGTELVVLSACETGLGDIRVGEGVFGLKRAFRAAGARAVMMSLWKVPDEQTRKLMELFYENWLHRRMTKSQALIEAQREMAQQYNDEYYWGAFVLVG